MDSPRTDGDWSRCRRIPRKRREECLRGDKHSAPGHAFPFILPIDIISVREDISKKKARMAAATPVTRVPNRGTFFFVIYERRKKTGKTREKITLALQRIDSVPLWKRNVFLFPFLSLFLSRSKENSSLTFPNGLNSSPSRDMRRKTRGWPTIEHNVVDVRVVTDPKATRMPALSELC